jgi:hypothetical protein
MRKTTYVHELTCWWEDIIHKYKDCLFCAQLDPFADDIDKLPHSQVSRNKVPAISGSEYSGGNSISSSIAAYHNPGNK